MVGVVQFVVRTVAHNVRVFAEVFRDTRDFLANWGVLIDAEELFGHQLQVTHVVGHEVHAVDAAEENDHGDPLTLPQMPRPRVLAQSTRVDE